MKKTKHFLIEELVCPDVFKRDGQAAFRYFRPVALDFLDWMREKLDRPVHVNDWKWGGRYSQRGLRCNLCKLVSLKNKLYMSAHILGAGIDFNVSGMTPDEVRDWIVDNIADFFLEFPDYTYAIRLEDSAFAPTWVHIDFYEHDGPGIVLFVKP